MSIRMLLNVQCDVKIYTLDHMLIIQTWEVFFFAAVDAVPHLHNVSAFVSVHGTCVSLIVSRCRSWSWCFCFIPYWHCCSLCLCEFCPLVTVRCFTVPLFSAFGSITCILLYHNPCSYCWLLVRGIHVMLSSLWTVCFSRVIFTATEHLPLKILKVEWANVVMKKQCLNVSHEI